jgi:hypothetical protein
VLPSGKSNYIDDKVIIKEPISAALAFGEQLQNASSWRFVHLSFCLSIFLPHALAKTTFPLHRDSLNNINY